MESYRYPKIGDKVKFVKVKPFWFIDMIENAKNLIVGREYTIKSVKINSSWICVKFKETGELEFNYSWFK